jgi:hypothetical protein
MDVTLKNKKDFALLLLSLFRLVENSEQDYISAPVI